MKKLISFFAIAALVGVIGCDSMTYKPIVNKDVMKQFMNPESLQHYLPEKPAPAPDTTGN